MNSKRGVLLGGVGEGGSVCFGGVRERESVCVCVCVWLFTCLFYSSSIDRTIVLLCLESLLRIHPGRVTD